MCIYVYVYMYIYVLIYTDSRALTAQAAKILRYMGHQRICDATFGLFLLTWIVARHVLFMRVVWSVYADGLTQSLPGCYNSVTGQMVSPDGGQEIFKNLFQRLLNPGGTVCVHNRIQGYFVGLLLVLQLLTLIWFAMICRVAWRVVHGGGADDSRSDMGGGTEDEHVADNGTLSEPLNASPSKLNGKPRYAENQDSYGAAGREQHYSAARSSGIDMDGAALDN